MATIRYLPGRRRARPRSSAPSRRPATTSGRGRRADADAIRRVARRRAAGATTPSAQREARDRCSSRRSSRSRVALGIMVAMFVPQTRVPMETLNWLALVPGDDHPGLGRAAGSTAPPGGPPGTATTNMDTLVAVGTTRGLGLQRRRDARARTSIHEAGPPARRPTSTRRRSSSASSCSVAGSRRAPRPARPARSGGWSALQPDHGPAASTDGGERDVAARGGRASATCCASGPARRCRSTASSSRARRRSTSRC